MSVNAILMAIMAAGAALGGLDRMLGSRFGLGERFDEGFRMLGPLGLSMAGIMCLIPALTGALARWIAPLCEGVGLDPGMLGGLIAIDMGGYQLAAGLARDPAVGRFGGILAAATFGCTAVYTIPVGFSLAPEHARPAFARGLMIGLIGLPLSLVPGGLLCGLGLGQTLGQCLPILILALAIALGLMKAPKAMVRAFSALAKGISLISYAGLILGAVASMTGWSPIPGMGRLEDAMAVVVSIGIVLLGSLPLAELMQRALRRPFERLGRRTGMNAPGTAALLVGAVSVTPALGLLGRMDERSLTVCGAALVSGASTLTAHFAFTMSVEPDLAAPLILCKLVGMAAAAALALLMTRRPAQKG